MDSSSLLWVLVILLILLLFVAIVLYCGRNAKFDCGLKCGHGEFYMVDPRLLCRTHRSMQEEQLRKRQEEEKG